jgi:putative DNA primase/helicase
MSPTIHYVPDTYEFKGNKFPTCSQEEFISRLQNKLPTYEVITNDCKVKYYFDFDHYIPPSEFNLEVAEAINNIFKKTLTESLNAVAGFAPKIHIMQSHSKNIGDGRGKYSLRYYISNMIAVKQNVKDFALDLNKYFEPSENELWDYIEKPLDDKGKYKGVFDKSVYDTNKKMRCYETNKPDEIRPLLLQEGTIEGTIITGCFDADATEVNYISQVDKAEAVVCYAPNESEIKLSDVDYLLNVCIREKMCSSGHHSEWNLIGQILKNELKDDATQPFVTWTNKFGSENKKNECINQITKYLKYTPLKDTKRLTYKSLHHYAKLHNPDAYNSRFTKKCKSDGMMNFDIINAGDYEYATYFKSKFGANFRCVSIKDKNIYCFNDDNLWTNNFEGGSKIREILSNEMRQDFIDYQDAMMVDLQSLDSNTEAFEKTSRSVKKVLEITQKLGKTNDKNNILREILDKIEDITFANDMNKKEYMLPIKGKKMLNMQTLEVTPRTIEHKFDYECDADYITMQPENEAFVKKYFLDLFSQKADMVQCVLDILKSIFTGVRTRYIYFFTGEGCNGKSLLFKVLKGIFKKAMDTIDSNVIIDQKISSQLTTQFEKLDKCRLGYVTELKEDMKLNEAIIKKISGGDEIDFRGLFKSNATINPTCNLCVLTNEMPQIKIEKAIVDRLVKIPFLNTFEVNTSFETELLARKDDIFSYIIKNGVIRDKFNLTQDMIDSKMETIEDNTKMDYLQNFIEATYTIVPFVKKEKIPRDTFRDGYNAFLKNKGLPMNKVSDVKFSRDIKKYGISVKESHGKTFYTGLVPKLEIDEDEDE